MGNLDARAQTVIHILRGSKKINFDELAYKAGIPKKELPATIRRLIHKQNFTGCVNWEDELIELKETISSECPDCGGKTDLKHNGSRICEYCSTEIYRGKQKNIQASECMFMGPEPLKKRTWTLDLNQVASFGILRIVMSAVSIIGEIVLRVAPTKEPTPILYVISFILAIVLIAMLVSGTRAVFEAKRGNKLRLKARIANLLETGVARSVEDLARLTQNSQRQIEYILDEIEGRSILHTSINRHSGAIEVGSADDRSEHKPQSCIDCGGLLAPLDIRAGRCPYCGTQNIIKRWQF